MLRQRLLTAVIGVPVVMAAFALGRAGIIALSVTVALLAVFELTRLLTAAGWLTVAWHGVTLVVVAQLVAASSPVAAAANATATALMITWVVLVVITIWQAVHNPERGTPQAVLHMGGGSMLAAVYIAWPLSLWPALYAAGVASDAGSGVVYAVLPLVVTWSCDIAAYFVGLRWGQRKLAPLLSPGKSLEGAAAGIAGGSLAGALVAGWFPWGAGLGAVIGAILAVCAQAGDLWESILKRVAGVKDSGVLLPGHGGVLDRFDGLLFVIPVTYLMTVVWR